MSASLVSVESALILLAEALLSGAAPSGPQPPLLPGLAPPSPFDSAPGMVLLLL